MNFMAVPGAPTKQPSEQRIFNGKLDGVEQFRYHFRKGAQLIKHTAERLCYSVDLIQQVTDPASNRRGRDGA